MKPLNGDLEALAGALTEEESLGAADRRADPAGRDTLTRQQICAMDCNGS
jgi:hypothetical protein